MLYHGITIRREQSSYLQTSLRLSLTLSDHYGKIRNVPPKPRSPDQLISQWIQSSEFTTTGRLAYASLIRRMVRSLGDTALKDVTEAQLIEYFRSIPSETTRQRAISAARSFFAYLHKHGEIGFDPMGEIRFRDLRERSVLDDVRLAQLLVADGVPKSRLDKLRWADYVLPSTDPDLAGGEQRLRVAKRLIKLSRATGELLKKRFAQFAGDRKAAEVLDHLDEPILPRPPVASPSKGRKQQ